MNASQIWLVIAQEFRVRLRTGRWRWLIASWAVLLFVITALLNAAVSGSYRTDVNLGVPLFGFLMYFTLGMMLVISPALTSQTINGDRERGTLATLQVTQLRPLEIALGKLFAGWGVGLVALAVSLPFTGFAMAQGGITIGRVAATYGVTALLIGVVCAVSQALSALVARSITSTLLSYLMVATLSVGTLLAFVLLLPQTRDDDVRIDQNGRQYTSSQTHQDRIWWLLAPNPFVVLADSAPRVPPRVTQYGETIRTSENDPLSAIGNEVRGIRYPQREFKSSDDYQDYLSKREDLPVWPTGLAINLVLGGAAVAVTTLRLRTPAKRLARGVRVA